MPTPRRVLSLLPILLAILLARPGGLAAQGRGRIVGSIIDQSTGGPVAGAIVQLDSADRPIRTTSAAIDGHYVLRDAPAGPATIRVRQIGYGPKNVTGIVVPEGGTIEVNVALDAKVFTIDELTVTATAEKSTVQGALDAERTAPNITNSISAEQIAQSPDADAGQAIKRVSGVSILDGKYVFVRGLGERYTTTSLNGARVPSPEPDRKVVPMDLFPANLLAGISTSKTFTPDQPGDFSGASVNITTREYPADRTFSLTMGSGWNSAATGTELPRAPTAGGEWIANGAPPRAIPADVEAAGDLNGLTQAQVNSLIGSFRNVWSPAYENGLPNAKFNVSLGGEDPIFGRPIGYIGSLTYTYVQDVKQNEVKGLAKNGPDADTAEPLNTYTGTSSTGAVLWGGMLNVYTRLGGTGRLTFNNTYTRGGDNSATLLGGFNEEFADTFQFARLTYVQRSVRSDQLAGQHLLGPLTTLDWSVTNSAVSRLEPDRSDIGYLAHPTGGGDFQPFQWFGQPRFATRSFLTTTESNWDLALNLSRNLGRGASTVILKAGAAYRTASRDATSRAYDINNILLSDADLSLAPEQIFTQAHIADSSFLLVANANGGDYTAEDEVLAGFVMATVPLSPRWTILGGVRVEDWNLQVNTRTSAGLVVPANPHHTDVLPSIALTFRQSDHQVFRASATQTLARPEYRELSPVPYFEQVGFATTFGNPDLDRGLIQNYDLRWEWYPGAGEIISVALFAKHFTAPIEKVIIQTTGANSLSFVNAEGADNYGIELEARKNLGFLGRSLERFSAYANATVMSSQITTGNVGISSLTNPDRPMIGQSPYVINAGLTYLSDAGRTSASVLYNVAGERILEVGSGGLPDAYEQPRSILDASLEQRLAQDLFLKVDGRNLLNSRYLMTQGGVTRYRYLTGRIWVVTFRWQP
ncbi:MAG TPA: TonB-dependent receptor [Gemmatimonadales bacterium]|nr:TonB-dependent receptor [Gemmatimonadales bacterium]